MIAIGICNNINGRVSHCRICKCGRGGERIAAATVVVVGVMGGVAVETVLVVVLTSRCHHFTPTTSTTTSNWSLQGVIYVTTEN